VLLLLDILVQEVLLLLDILPAVLGIPTFVMTFLVVLSLTQ